LIASLLGSGCGSNSSLDYDDLDGNEGIGGSIGNIHFDRHVTREEMDIFNRAFVNW
jgi:hypothetical protein